ncbi:MAG TPA: hypothetical protein ENI08_01255 [Candidatus Dependentiae bacterium]|nr:hypothetical protein [Candidatus Dependentiae bacterium]
MISSNGNRKMNLLLVLAIGTVTGIVNQSSAHLQLPTNPTARAATYALVIGAPSFIWLYSKTIPKELRFKTKLNDTWSDCLSDWVEILKVWNIAFQPCEYKKLISKRWIGTRLSILDEKTKEISKDGLKEVTLMDKKLECLPTGVCGKIDVYIVCQLKKLFDAVSNVEKALIVYCLFHGQDIEKFAEVWLPKKA